MSLRGSINFFPGSASPSNLVLVALRETFEDVDVRAVLVQTEPRTTQGVGTIVEDYFVLAPPVKEDFTIIVSSYRLVTPFGYRIAGEARENTVVIAGPSIHAGTVHRLIRHELGHVFRLSEHLDCVMSPHYVDDPSYCATCTSALRSQDIKLVGGKAL